MENEFLAEKYKATLQGWLQSNQAMIDFSKMSLRGAMLLNGAGVIPIVYSKVEYLYDSALLFGVGAFLAACASGMTYLVQWAVTSSWGSIFIQHPFRTSSLDQEEAKGVQTSSLAYQCVFPLRLAAIALVLASLGCFAWGLYAAHKTISSGYPEQKKQQQISKSEEYPLPPQCCFVET